MLWKFTLHETKATIILDPEAVVAVQESSHHPKGHPWRLFIITLCTGDKFEVESFMQEIDRFYKYRNSFGETMWQLPRNGRGRNKKALMKTRMNQ